MSTNWVTLGIFSRFSSSVVRVRTAFAFFLSCMEFVVGFWVRVFIFDRNREILGIRGVLG